LGLACQLQDKFKESLANYYKAIELKEDHGIAHMSLFGLLKKLRKKDEAKKHEKIAHKLIKKDDEYNRACFESLCGNVDEALALLKIAIEKELSDKEWAKEDPDFENLRDDPRFWEIVGEEMPSS
jgi:tetratricopeptide (TPR) repeat protein